MRRAAAVAWRSSSTTAATFEDIGLGAELCRAMRQMGHDTPTDIQRAAIPHLLEGGDTVVGSHTGSGKSLAFMLPLLERQRRWEASVSGGGRIKPRPQRPRSIILAPTRELVTQIVGVAKTVGRASPFRVTSLVGGGGQKRQRSALHSAGVDMLVATPQQLQQQHAERKLFLTDLRTVVVDEADTMLCPKSGHADDVLALLNSARHMRARGGGGGGGASDDRNSAASRGVQLIAVGATLDRATRRDLLAAMPGAAFLTTDSMHRLPGSLVQRFAKAGMGGEKLASLLDVVAPLKELPTIIFCHSSSSCRYVVETNRDYSLPLRSIRS